jgi:hypothetical protein
MKKFLILVAILGVLFSGCGSPTLSKDEISKSFMSLLSTALTMSINSSLVNELDVEGKLEGKLLSGDASIISLSYSNFRRSIKCNEKISTSVFDGEIRYAWSYTDVANNYLLELFGTIAMNGASCVVAVEVNYNSVNNSFELSGSVCGIDALEIQNYLIENNCSFEQEVK